MLKLLGLFVVVTVAIPLNAAIAGKTGIKYIGSLANCDRLLRTITLMKNASFSSQDLVFAKLTDLDLFVNTSGLFSSDFKNDHHMMMPFMAPSRSGVKQGFIRSPTGMRVADLFFKESLYIFSQAKGPAPANMERFVPVNNILTDRQEKIKNLLSFWSSDKPTWLEQMKVTFKGEPLPEAVIFVNTVGQPNRTLLPALVSYSSLEFMETWLQANKKLKEAGQPVDKVYSTFVRETKWGPYILPEFIDTYGPMRTYELYMVISLNTAQAVSFIKPMVKSRMAPAFANKEILDLLSKAELGPEILKYIKSNTEIWLQIERSFQKSGLPQFKNLALQENRQKLLAFLDDEMISSITRAAALKR